MSKSYTLRELLDLGERDKTRKIKHDYGWNLSEGDYGGGTCAWGGIARACGIDPIDLSVGMGIALSGAGAVDPFVSARAVSLNDGSRKPKATIARELRAEYADYLDVAVTL